MFSVVLRSVEDIVALTETWGLGGKLINVHLLIVPAQYFHCLMSFIVVMVQCQSYVTVFVVATKYNFY